MDRQGLAVRILYSTENDIRWIYTENDTFLFQASIRLRDIKRKHGLQ